MTVSCDAQLRRSIVTVSYDDGQLGRLAMTLIWDGLDCQGSSIKGTPLVMCKTLNQYHGPIVMNLDSADFGGFADFGWGCKNVPFVGGAKLKPSHSEILDDYSSSDHMIG